MNMGLPKLYKYLMSWYHFAITRSYKESPYNTCTFSSDRYEQMTAFMPLAKLSAYHMYVGHILVYTDSF